MTAPKIDTQAPERTFGIIIDGEEWIPASLSAAREAAAWLAMRDAAAQWHDLRIDQLNQQIRENDEYLARSGKTHSEANDYCRESVLIHRVASDSIRGLTPPTDPAAALDRLIAERVREAVEAERGACAKVAEAGLLPCDIGGDLVLHEFTADTIAAAIRARGTP